jgi:prevent-host-death family protein
MGDAETRIMSVRDARAHLAEIVSSAIDGNPTLITRNGEQVAAVVSLEEYQIIEDVIDEAFSRRADKIIDEESGEQLHSMTEIIADLFDAHRLPKGAA